MAQLSEHVRALAATALLLCVCALSASAEGLTQVRFQGAISHPGGAHVEVEVSARPSEEDAEVERLAVFVHLAHGTTAADLASLVAERLRRVRIDVVLSQGSPEAGSTSLFVERARRVRLRLGHGLAGSVSLCEEAPMSVALERPGQDAEGARITIGLSAYYLHTKQHRHSTLAVDVAADATTSAISELLANRGIEAGWGCERPTLQSWRVNSLLDGGRVTGLSIELDSASDWALVVELEGEGG